MGARVVPTEAAGEAAEVGSATAEGVATTAAEMASASARGVSATAPAATTGMLRPSQSRRSRYRRTQKQGADGSHYISRGRFGHNSSPLFQRASTFEGRWRAYRLDPRPALPFKLALIRTQ